MTVTYLKPAISRKKQLAANPINPDALHSMRQCQAWAGVCNTTWYRLAKLGKAPPFRKIGNRTMVLGSDFIAWRDGLTSTAA